MFNIIKAIIPNKKKKEEKSTIEVEIFFSIYFDGLSSDGTQETIRDAYRKGNKIPAILVENKQNILYSTIENPNIKNSPNRDKEDSLTKHFSITISLTPYNSIRNQYINQLIHAKNYIENEVNSFVSNPEIESIKTYFYLFGYNQGEFIANIVNSIGVFDDDDKLKELIQKYFDLKNFLQNNKIKCRIIESITTFEPAGFIESFINNGFVKLVTGRSDLLYKKEDDDKQGFNYPSEENISIYDAVLMCQHTYESEDPSDKSIFSIIHSFFCRQKMKASKDEKRVQIQVDNDIYSNVQENSISTIDKNKDSVTLKDNWITTEAEWQSVSSKSAEVKESGIDLRCRLTGFYSKLYKRIENGVIKSYTYCTAGTEPSSFNDWFFANFLQGLTGISFQYTQSVRNAKKMDLYCKSQKVPLYFVGHSLGGGLASNNALVTSTRHAITFNAAGLNPFRIMATLLINNPKDFFNRTGRKNRIHPFIIDGEAVQLLRFIGQPAMSSDKDREKRYSPKTEIVHDEIKKETNTLPRFEHMGIIEKHGVTNFLRIKKLSELRLNT